MWLAAWTAAGRAEEPDWKKVKSYQYGEDLQPMLSLEREVYKSLASPDQRKQMAAQLVAIMADSQATPAARQFAARELWIVGTEANVPVLEKMLNDPVVVDWAREALEMIPGGASGAAPCAALGRLKGRTLVGVINSLANRGDTKAADALSRLANDNDVEVAAAAARAIIRIGGGYGATAGNPKALVKGDVSASYGATRATRGSQCGRQPGHRKRNGDAGQR